MGHRLAWVCVGGGLPSCMLRNLHIGNAHSRQQRLAPLCPGHAGQLDTAALEGFPAPPGPRAQSGLDGAVLLHTSVALADRLRLQAACEAGPGMAGAPHACIGRLLVCKAQVAGRVQEAWGHVPPAGLQQPLRDARTQQLQVSQDQALPARCTHSGVAPASCPGPTASVRPTQAAASVCPTQAAACLEDDLVTAAGYPGCTAVYRTRQGDAQQRTWCA